MIAAQAAPIEELAADSIFYVVMFSIVFLGLIYVGWHATAYDGNIGHVLSTALPSSLLMGVVLLALWWLRYQPIYLAQQSSWVSQVVFFFWGFAVGYSINYMLALVGYDFQHPWMAVLTGLGLILLALFYFAVASNAAAAENWGDAFTQARVPWSRWTVGFVVGVLRPLEWFLLEIVIRPPGIHDPPHTRTWWAAGATPAPPRRQRKALDEWLSRDWQQGVRIASELSAFSRQRLSLAAGVRRSLSWGKAEELPARLAFVCDSEAPCRGAMVKPPVVKSKTKADRSDMVRYNQEAELADVLHHRVAAPAFRQGKPEDILQGAYLVL